MKDTFTRLVAYSFRWARGERAFKLTATIAGLIPDAIADASRQVMRALLPLDGTMPDMLPSQCKRFGLPPYMPGVIDYFAQLLRLQGVLEMHSNAGSTLQLYSELILIGIQDAGFEITDRGWWVTTTDLVAAPVIGDTWVLADSVSIGDSAGSIAKTRSVIQMLAYFKPAADWFEGFKEP